MNKHQFIVSMVPYSYTPACPPAPMFCPEIVAPPCDIRHDTKIAPVLAAGAAAAVAGAGAAYLYQKRKEHRRVEEAACYTPCSNMMAVAPAYGCGTATTAVAPYCGGAAAAAAATATACSSSAVVVPQPICADTGGRWKRWCTPEGKGKTKSKTKTKGKKGKKMKSKTKCKTKFKPK